MPQTGYTPIQIYSTSTAAAVPTAGSLTNSTLGSELAINITDGKLFYKDNANVVQVIGWKVVPTSAGGTGLTSFTANQVFYASSTSAVGQSANLSFNGTTLGVGGAANASYGISITSSTLTGLGQIGVFSTPTITSAATTGGYGYYARVFTEAASFTVADVFGLRCVNASKGLGSTITNQYGIYVDDQTQGTNNYGIRALVSSGANKWNIYASGTAANYFAGGVDLGATTDPGAGNLSLTGNVIIGTSGKGIDFSATAGTGTSELFNDYEEGTWTPFVSDDSGSASEGQTYSVQVGTYTKIGNTVFVQGRIVMSSLGTLSTAQNVRLNGFPFTSSSTTNNFAVVSFGQGQGLSITAGQSLTGYLNPAGIVSTIRVWSQTTGTSELLFSQLTASGGFIFSCSYKV